MVGCDDLLLPLEIQREILTRVLIKTILRCRSVCKSWYSLISCPDFISDYSTRNLNKNDNRVLLRLEDKDHVLRSYRSYNELSMESREHDDITDRPYLVIIGTCNGLICLSDTRPSLIGLSSDDHTFLIWNPTIRKIVELPSRTFSPLTQRLSFCGFGFDSKTNDYKVLRVVNNVKIGYSYYDVVCEIFDLKKGVWRIICPHMPSRNRYIPECYLDGAVHWSGRGVVSSFSFSDECFHEMKMPNYEKSFQNYGLGDRTQTRCVTFSGLIHVMMWTGLEDCSVWVMKEYGITESWTKLFDIDLRGLRDVNTICLCPSSFRLWKNGEVLMVHAHRVDTDGEVRGKDDLVSYNPENKKYKNIFSIISGHISYMCQYRESLVLM